MSTQLQEIITDSAIKSFNMGYQAGMKEAQLQVIEIIKNSTVSAKSMIDGFVIEGITLTPSELIKIIEETK